MRDFRQALADMESKHGDDVILGMVDGCAYKSRALDYIYNEISSMIRCDYLVSDNSKLSDEDFRAETERMRLAYLRDKQDIYSVLTFYWPNVDQEADGKLYIWPDVSAKSKGRTGRTPIKIGRALRRMLPVLTDDEVSFLVDQIKKTLFTTKWSIKTGWTRADFKRAYSYQQAAYENIETTWAKKHMANSCMRYTFDNLPCHPAEAYASGEFEAVWIETEEGLIGGRVVVWHDPTGNKVPQTAPIYAVSDVAHDMLYQYLRSMSAATPFDSNMSGALMLAIPSGGGYVAPYLDLEPQALRSVIEKDCHGKDKEFLRISADGEIDATRYDGILYSGSRKFCCCCEEPVSDGYEYVHDYETYCDYCYHERFFTCEHCEESSTQEYSSMVNVARRWGRAQEQWCEHCVSSDSVECTDGELWDQDDTTLTGDGDVVDSYTRDEDYSYCSLAGEYYRTEDMVETENDGLVSMDGIEYVNARGNIHYTLNEETGVYTVALPSEAKEASNNE